MRTGLAEPRARDPDGRRSWAARAGLPELAVWAVWVGSVVVAAEWVGRFGRRFPFADDWFVVDVLAGERPLTAGWLWSQYGEHRIVLPRLVITQLTRFNGDFRSTLWLNLALLAALAAAAILVMRRVRGRTVLSDAFFPLLLLSLGLSGLNYDFQVHFVSVAVIAAAVLLIMVRYGLEVPAGPMWLAAALLLLLVGVGAQGLTLLPGLGAWFVLAVVRLRRTRPVQAALLAVAAVGIALGAAGYFVGYQPSASTASFRSRSVSDVLVAAGHALSAPGGDRMTEWWPWSGVLAAVLFAATAAVLVSGLVAASRYDGAPERHRAVALLLFGFAAAILVLALAWGRGGMLWQRGLEHHYGSLLLPYACWTYVVWDRYGRRLGRPATATLCLAALAVYAAGAADARTSGPERNRQAAAFERDLCAGLPARELAGKHIWFLYYTDDELGREQVAAGIETLRRHRIGPFGC